MAATPLPVAPPAVVGSLTITVIQARNLYDGDTFTKQDPYCQLWCGDGESEKYKTKTCVDGGIQPRWDTAFLFNLTGAEDLFHLHIYTDQAIGSRFIARFDTVFDRLKVGETDWYPLVNPDKLTEARGEVQLAVEFKGTGLTLYAPGRHIDPIAFHSDRTMTIGIAVDAPKTAETEKLARRSQAARAYEIIPTTTFLADKPALLHKPATKPSSTCALCCVDFLKNFFGCFLSCMACTCEGRRYTSFMDSAVADAVALTQGWVDAKVPLPEDGVMKDYNHNVAAAFGLNPELLTHADSGSSLGYSGFKYLLVAEANDRWPTEGDRDFKSQDEARAILFNSKYPIPDPLPAPLTTVAGLVWLFTHSQGACLMRRVPGGAVASTDAKVVDFDREGKEEKKEDEKGGGSSGGGEAGASTYFVEADTFILRGCQKQKGCTDLNCRIRFRVEGDGKWLTLVELQWGDIICRDEKDPNFEDCARAISTAVITVVNLQHHGLYTHLVCSDGFVTANLRLLPGVHPVRRLLAMCEFGVHNVNEGAVMTLLTAHGSGNFTLNFDNDGVSTLLKRGAQQYAADSVHHMPGFLATRGLPLDALAWAPILEDSLDWWATFQQYCDAYLRVFYPDDESLLADRTVCAWYEALPTLIRGSTAASTLAKVKFPFQEISDLCTLIIFVSTVYHERVGSEGYRLGADPYVVSSQWREGKTLEQKISSEFITIRRRSGLLATTARSPRLLTDWSYMAPPSDTHGLAAAIMRKFKTDMEQVGIRIRTRNKSRKWPITLLLPENLGCSVAI